MDKPTRIPFGQTIAHPSEMSPGTRGIWIHAGDKTVIAWCKENKPDELPEDDKCPGCRKPHLQCDCEYCHE